jgi:hypothetical protein
MCFTTANANTARKGVRRSLSRCVNACAPARVRDFTGLLSISDKCVAVEKRKIQPRLFEDKKAAPVAAEDGS